jgi:hypothetical protein
MDSRDSLGLWELQSSAEELPAADSGVQRFVKQAFERLHNLTTRVADLESEVAALRGSFFMDGDHRRRLESMVDDQTEALHNAQASLNRIRALVDATRWADHSGGTSSNLVLRLDDVERALARQP